MIGEEGIISSAALLCSILTSVLCSFAGLSALVGQLSLL